MKQNFHKDVKFYEIYVGRLVRVSHEIFRQFLFIFLNEHSCLSEHKQMDTL